MAEQCDHPYHVVETVRERFDGKVYQEVICGLCEKLITTIRVK